MLIRMALRNVLRQRRRSAFAVAVIVAATAALLFTAGFVRFSFAGLEEGIVSGGLGHLELRPVRADGLPPEAGDPDWRLAEWRGLRDEAETVPGVVAAEATLQLSGLLSTGDRSLSFVGFAVEPDREKRMGFATRLLEGEGLPESPPEEGADTVLLGRGLARAAGVGVGELVTLVAMGSEGMLNALDATVAGIMTTGVQELDARFLKLPLRSAQRLLETEAASAVVLVLDDAASLPRVRAALEARVHGAEPPILVRDWKERAPFHAQVESLYGAIFAFLGSVVFVLAALSTSSTLLLSVFERVRELGTLRAIGTGRLQVALLVFWEACWLAALGTAGGVASGLALAWLLEALGVQMPPPPGGTGPLDLQLLILPGDVALACGVTALIAVVAAVVPAVSAARLRIAEALAHV